MRSFGVGVGLVAALAAYTPAMAQPASCARLAEAVEAGARNLAFQHADALTASTTAQAQLRAAEQANTLSLLQLNLQLMAANRCPMPGDPITRGAYMRSVRACLASQGSDAQQKCDRQRWVAEPGAAEPTIAPR